MKTKSEQLGLLNVVWIGFSFIAGITFTGAFAGIIAGQSEDQTIKTTGVGIHIFWIYVLEGFVAFMCAWSFAKLVKIHPEANGGGSQYARTAFGKFWGLLMGLLNYAVIPVIATALVVTMVRQNFDGGRFNLVGFDSEKGEFSGAWGAWGNIYLDLIAYFLYMLAAGILFLGMKKYKSVAMVIAYMTWGITILLMVFGLTAGFMNLGKGENGLGEYASASDLTYKTFSNAFTTSFFAFCGIETFITTGKNIKNRNKTMPIAIIIIMILTTAFYIIFTLIVMMAVTNGFTGNPNLQIFAAFESPFLKTFGPILIIICTVLMRFNSSLQITLFGATTLEPMASQRFVPNALKEENHENLPVKGVWLTVIVFTLTYFMFVIVPDIVQGATKQPSPFNFGTLASASSIILMAIYFINIPAAIYQGFKKKMKVNIFEYIGWFIALGVLTFLLIVHFMGLFGTFANPYTDKGEFDIQGVLAASFQLIYMGAIITTALLLYFVYHKKQLEKIKEDKDALKELAQKEEVYRILTAKELEDLEKQIQTEK